MIGIALISFFLLACSPNVMHNYLVDDKERSHVYFSDDIHNNSTHWCFMHGRMENIRIKHPVILEIENEIK